VFFSLFLLLQAGGDQPVNAIAMQALPFVLIAIVFYFLLFMPMQKQKKRQQEMLAALKSGDAVITTGGIVGTIVSVEGETITVRVKPDNLKLQFSRASVSSLATPEGSK
jgi:preprotein translocase subunit YajC